MNAGSKYILENCVANCLECDVANECVKCKPGYLYTDATIDTCTPCPTGCADCTGAAAGKCVTTKCTVSTDT